MKNSLQHHQKSLFILLLTLPVFLAFLAVSCTGYTVVFEEERDLSNFILTDTGQSVELKLKNYLPGYEYKWYECTKSGIVFGDALPENKSKPFDKAGIQTYKCIGSKPGNSDIESNIFYVIYTALPTVYIDTDNGEKITSKSEYKEASLVIKDGNNELANKDDILIKGRGNTSWRSIPKKAYNIKLQSKLDNKLFGMKKNKRWCLIANATDPSMLGNWIASKLGNECFNSGWNPKHEFVNVVFNGEYSGTYTFSESIRIDENRVDIEDISKIENDTNNDGIISIEDGGFIVEFTLGDENHLYSTLHGIAYSLKDPDLDDLSENYSNYEIADYIQNKVNAVEASIMGDSNTPYEEVFDIDAAVDWYIVNDFMANTEASFKTSVYAYYDPKDKKLKMGPNWDFDRCIAESYDLAVNTDINFWFNALLENDNFRNAVKERWNNKKSYIIGFYDELSMEAKKIDVAVQADRIRWNINETKSPEELTHSWIIRRYNFFDSYINSTF